MEMIRPKISVLMATYNTPNEWLTEAIESILSQTLTDFEFIIVDDCSSNDIGEVQAKFQDTRIIWLRNEHNLGLTKSLNKALKMARGEYIARMDADDIALRERFAVQVDYMDKHRDIIACGSYRRAFGCEDKNEIWNLPPTREEQQVQLFFFNCGVTHPTAMLRKSMLDKYEIKYNESYKKAQDYGLWVQCTRYAPMAMIPKVLLKYRKSEQQISRAGKSSQVENAGRVKTDQLVALGISPTEEEKILHLRFCTNQGELSYTWLEAWINKLKNSNREKKYFDIKMFDEILDRRWYDWCKRQYLNSKCDETRRMLLKARKGRYILHDMTVWLKRQIVQSLHRVKSVGDVRNGKK